MQLPKNVVDHMLIDLSQTYHFPLLPLLGTVQPKILLWKALNSCLLDLRMPLFYKRLGKKPPKPAAYTQAIQRSLVFLTAFAEACGTNQAIVSSSDGWVRSISFQPRPLGMNWTAEYAIDPPLVMSHHTEQLETVSVEDVLHLAAKIIYAVSGHNAGDMPNATGTIMFLRDSATDHLKARVVVRELGGMVHRAHMPN